MNSIKSRINQLLPIINNNTSKDLPIKKIRRAKFDLRNYSQFENQNVKEEAEMENQTLKQKIKAIKKMQRYKINT